MKRAGLALIAAIVAFAIFYVGAGLGWWGHYEGPGKIEGTQSVRSSLPAPNVKQILFGDLHVHTTFSTDAFAISLPLLQGQGTRPPADAADFARYCSALDFWALTDHAEGLTPDRWKDSVDTVIEANRVAGDPANPDIVTFLGWEWSQVGFTAAEHWGHKNVILRDIDRDRIPARPIAAAGRAAEVLSEARPFYTLADFALFAPGGTQRYFDYARFTRERAGIRDCPTDVKERELPRNCFESALTPKDLFEKLDDWGFPAFVIPHGNTWGFYTPADASWDHQLAGAMNDPKRQFLVEIYSGHGNSEEYRDWRPVTVDAQGKLQCPMPTKDYLPECWRAGQIIEERCLKAGEMQATCTTRAADAREKFLRAGISGFRTVPGQSTDEWLDAGQCRDCFRPTYDLRPANSVQYALALTNFDTPGDPKHFEFGIIASSDTHQAKPGNGYKEASRADLTEGASGAVSEKWNDVLMGGNVIKTKDPMAIEFDSTNVATFGALNTERFASFMMTGGLVAAHSTGRDRQAIWDALQRKEVYGTTGERILLWFDLVNGPSGEIPMGSKTSFKETPHFRVHAIGAFKQKPGCPQDSLRAISPARLDHLCHGECYNPSDERKLITRIEIVRITPQITKDEKMGPLIKDPWKTLPCAPDQTGCTVEFDDPDFAPGGRPVTYYARAIEEPRLAINADNLRCEKDANGVCIKVNACYSDSRTPHDDNCLALSEEKAWSSPIFLYPSL